MPSNFLSIVCLVLNTVFTTVAVSQAYNNGCRKLTSCSCQMDDGIIDLSPLAAPVGRDPRFKDVQDEAGSYYYSWNPCNSFTEGSCTSVSGCETDLTSYFSIGTEDSATFVNDATEGLYIQYTATTDVTRTMNVYLKCDMNQEGSLDIKGEDPPSSATYKMTLSSKYCCPKSMTTPTPTRAPTPTRTPTPAPIPCPNFYTEFIITLLLASIGLSLLVLIFLSSIIICLIVRNYKRIGYFVATDKTPLIQRRET